MAEDTAARPPGDGGAGRKATSGQTQGQSTMVTAAVGYVARGWAVVPIPPGTKGPTKTPGWNKPGGYVTTEQEARKVWTHRPGHGVGLLHSVSRTCALDVDHVAHTRAVFTELGLDYDDLLDGAPRLRGRPERDKGLFLAPKGAELGVKKLVWPAKPEEVAAWEAEIREWEAKGKNGEKPKLKPHTIFELRAGPVQDVLPPTVHPDTARPYEWVQPPTEALPELPAALLDLWQHWPEHKPGLDAMCPWAEPRAAEPERATGEHGSDVIGAYNAAHPLAELLEARGYKRVGNRYLSPTSSSGLPGVSILDSRAFSHHASDPLADGHAHDPFDVFRLLAHGGDFTAAVKAAAEELRIPYTPKTDGTDEQTIARLATLSTLDYDRCREKEAERLGVRLGTLDATVKAVRPKAAAEEATDEMGFTEVEPSADPVNGAALLDEITATVQRFIVCLPETARAAALWCTMTWFMDVVGVAPIAAITSPEKRCGKTVFLTVLSRLTFRPLAASNISPPALFRAVEAWTPTLLIDEADSFLKDNEELRGVINSGHTRDTAFVIRCEGEDLTPKRFSTWGAKALAAIGNLPDTNADRAVPLEMRRKRSDEKVERLRYAEAELFDTLRAKLARWAEDHRETIRHARPALPEALHDRAQDNFEPLLAIADTAGGEWPKLAREAALKLYGAEPATLSVGVELLRDVKAVWKDEEPHLATATLIERLTEDHELRWATYGRGDKPLTARQLAGHLKKYGIRSKGIRTGEKTPKGYEREQFAEAWDRYIHRTPPSLNATTQHHNETNDLGRLSSATEEGGVADRKEANSLNPKGCCGVADRKGGASVKGGNGADSTTDLLGVEHPPPADNGYLAAVLVDPEADAMDDDGAEEFEL